MNPGQRNIEYQTGWLSDYFSSHRVRWEQFYPSERAVLEAIGVEPRATVLDVGCGCGGLGLALHERFGVHRYLGVDINAAAAETARLMNPRAQVLTGDVLQLSTEALAGQTYDVVFSLSCIDWNVQFDDMLSVVWSHVKPGGHLVATFRLTDGPSCADFDRSYQYMNADGNRNGERAAYVVSNAVELWRLLATLGPDRLLANGYWGRPSATAVTPYERLCFVAVALRKPVAGAVASLEMEMDLPPDILAMLYGFGQ